jgi:hypothetical protein
MNTSSTSEQNRMLPALGGRALLFFMVALAACAIALFFYEYHLEKIRALESLKVSFAERLDALDRCLYVARDHVALMQDWAQTFWGDASRPPPPPPPGAKLRDQ